MQTETKTILKGQVYRIYPNKSQKTLINKHFGANRWVWNFCLNLNKERYKNKEPRMSRFDLQKLLPPLKKQEETKWLKEVCAISLIHTIMHLEESYQKLFKKLSKSIKFKSKYKKQSYTTNNKIKINQNKIHLPKMQEGIKIKLHRPIEGEIRKATVSRVDRKYYVTLLIKQEYTPHPKTGNTIGIDVGIKDLAVLSSGEKYKNPKALKKYSKRIIYHQRQMSKLYKKGKAQSNQYKKHKLMKSKFESKVTRIRHQHQHEVSAAIVKNNDVIAIEDLAIKNMMKNRKLAKALADASMSSFIDKVRYKAEFNDRDIKRVGRFFPSSKKCHHCGTINKSLTLKDRTWKCINVECGKTLDRDKNAAINIHQEALS